MVLLYIFVGCRDHNFGVPQEEILTDELVNMWWNLEEQDVRLWIDSTGHWYYDWTLYSFYTHENAFYGGTWSELGDSKYEIWSADVDATYVLTLERWSVDPSCFDGNFGIWWQDIACPYLPVETK